MYQPSEHLVLSISGLPSMPFWPVLDNRYLTIAKYELNFSSGRRRLHMPREERPPPVDRDLDLRRPHVPQAGDLRY